MRPRVVFESHVSDADHGQTRYSLHRMLHRIFITGGAGFIGSHLAERFLKEGRHVTVLDNLSTGLRANVEALQKLAPERFRFIDGCATDFSLVAPLVADCDAVVHLAAAVGVRLVVEQPIHTIRTNIGATETVLESASVAGVPLLYASTSEVYGKSAKLPFTENADLVLGPTSIARWGYAASKATGEWMALAYGAERELDVTIVRLFNTVGPRQRGQYGMVLPNFVRAALAGEPLRVFGDGQQTRCFAHVKDVTRILGGLLDEPAARGSVFNVGNDDEVSILELAQRVCSVAGSDSAIELVPYSEAYGHGFEDMRRRVPSLAALEAALGDRPRTGLDEIITDLIGVLA
jgi:UDP-glucose 4-epimerase